MADKSFSRTIVERGSSETLNCPKDHHIKIEKAVWNARSGDFNRLNKNEKDAMKKLNHAQVTFHSLAKLCNKNPNCVVPPLDSKVSKNVRLACKVDFKCYNVGPCPNKTFKTKHVVPQGYTANQLPAYAKNIENLRRKNNWALTNRQTFFIGAANMVYKRDPNDEFVCDFTHAAQAFECNKDTIKKVWNCHSKGNKVAKHKTISGHLMLSNLMTRTFSINVWAMME